VELSQKPRAHVGSMAAPDLNQVFSAFMESHKTITRYGTTVRALLGQRDISRADEKSKKRLTPLRCVFAVARCGVAC
jgi:hypothetical protein